MITESFSDKGAFLPGPLGNARENQRDRTQARRKDMTLRAPLRDSQSQGIDFAERKEIAFRKPALRQADFPSENLVIST